MRVPWQKKVLEVADDDHPVGAQLMGTEPGEFAHVAGMLADAGYDAIDLNFACPVDKVTKKKRGGYLLDTPEQTLQIIRETIDGVGGKAPVTVKLRMGLDDSEESRRKFFKIVDGVLEHGVSAITIHGRTVQQKYRGASNWDIVKTVKKIAGAVSVFGSGDLFTAADCLKMLEITGVDGVSIARGAIGNPWIFKTCIALSGGEIEPELPSVIEQGNVLRAHFHETVRYYGYEKAGMIMKKTAIMYSRYHPDRKEVRNAFNYANTTEAFLDAVNRWYPLEPA